MEEYKLSTKERPICPKCKSEDVEVNGGLLGNGEAWWEITCFNCGYYDED